MDWPVRPKGIGQADEAGHTVPCPRYTENWRVIATSALNRQQRPVGAFSPPRLIGQISQRLADRLTQALDMRRLHHAQVIARDLDTAQLTDWQDAIPTQVTAVFLRVGFPLDCGKQVQRHAVGINRVIGLRMTVSHLSVEVLPKILGRVGFQLRRQRTLLTTVLQEPCEIKGLPVCTHSLKGLKGLRAFASCSPELLAVFQQVLTVGGLQVPAFATLIHQARHVGVEQADKLHLLVHTLQLDGDFVGQKPTERPARQAIRSVRLNAAHGTQQACCQAFHGLQLLLTEGDAAQPVDRNIAIDVHRQRREMHVLTSELMNQEQRTLTTGGTHRHQLFMKLRCSLFAAAIQQARQVRDAGVLENVGQRHRQTTLYQLVDQSHCHQRVTSEIEEAVITAHLL
ncbi:hypothetical protein ALQ37_05534 [Pseudomonas syringae pv. aptata]|uniref:Uncharacterized protein n=1 Tax=Pseudomonas syringae pv. aptata TaxID=83167 RepID=A0A3M3WD76_PSEAP|nr:hypothetical protein ALQ37_05534 [Pseudomonas syringae pv. aptata]